MEGKKGGREGGDRQMEADREWDEQVAGRGQVKIVESAGYHWGDRSMFNHSQLRNGYIKKTRTLIKFAFNLCFKNVKVQKMKIIQFDNAKRSIIISIRRYDSAVAQCSRLWQCRTIVRIVWCQLNRWPIRACVAL